MPDPFSSLSFSIKLSPSVNVELLVMVRIVVSAYAPNGLGNITPADMKRMWEQHAPFAPDAMMWLGFDMKPGKTDTEMTFPKGSPESWAYAKDLFAEVHGTTGTTGVSPVAVAKDRDPPVWRTARHR